MSYSGRIAHKFKTTKTYRLDDINNYRTYDNEIYNFLLDNENASEEDWFDSVNWVGQRPFNNSFLCQYSEMVALTGVDFLESDYLHIGIHERLDAIYKSKMYCPAGNLGGDNTCVCRFFEEVLRKLEYADMVEDSDDFPPEAVLDYMHEEDNVEYCGFGDDLEDLFIIFEDMMEQHICNACTAQYNTQPNWTKSKKCRTQHFHEGFYNADGKIWDRYVDKLQSKCKITYDVANCTFLSEDGHIFDIDSYHRGLNLVENEKMFDYFLKGYKKYIRNDVSKQKVADLKEWWKKAGHR